MNVPIPLNAKAITAAANWVRYWPPLPLTSPPHEHTSQEGAGHAAQAVGAEDIKRVVGAGVAALKFHLS